MSHERAFHKHVSLSHVYLAGVHLYRRTSLLGVDLLQAASLQACVSIGVSITRVHLIRRASLKSRFTVAYYLHQVVQL